MATVTAWLSRALVTTLLLVVAAGAADSQSPQPLLGITVYQDPG